MTLVNKDDLIKTILSYAKMYGFQKAEVNPGN